MGSSNLVHRLNRRWDLVVLGIVVNACLGTVYSWSVFRDPLELALTLTPAQSGIPYSVFLAAFAFSMPVAGAVMSRLGPRLTLAAGGLLVGAGWMSGGLAESFPLLVAGYGVLGGAGVGFAYGVPLAVAGSWFPDRRGLAMGLTLAGFGVSPFVTAPLAKLLIQRLGVQSAMVALGAGFLVIVVRLAAFFRMAPGRSLAPEPGEAATAAGPVPAEAFEAPVATLHDVSPIGMLRSRSFYGLWICYVIGSLAGLTAIGMTASFGSDVAGLTPAAAAAGVSAFGVLNGIGRPIFGGITDAFGVRPTVILSFALIAAGSAIAVLTQSGVALPFFVGFGVYWLMLGGWLAIAPAATTKLFGVRDYPRNYGIMYTAYGVGALVGGVASGALYASFGSYRPLFVFVAVLSLMGVIVALVLLPGRRAARGLSPPRLSDEDERSRR
ncbi:MAG: OFA family MFS transporter [Spirochaetota bacterium]